MNGKRKSHTEESPELSAAEDSDSAPPARKKQRNGHEGEIVLDDDEMNGVADDVKPEHANGNGVQADENADNSSEDEDEKDYVDEENEEGQLIRRYKRRVVKLERGSDG
jgi:TFIIF-interacting CTD phosphatase-like protein